MGGGSKRNASTYSLMHMPYTTGKKIGGGDGSNSTMQSGFPLPYFHMFRWGMGWGFPKREKQEVDRSASIKDFEPEAL
jgi:hypothetical protein